jgi:hypothetical protein
VQTRFRDHLTYANVMATIAVFIALGGSSYAALRITGKDVPKDALTGADIKNLTGRDVRNNSLTGADVTNLTSADVADGRLLAQDFAAGQLPAGPPGPTASSSVRKEPNGGTALNGNATVIDLASINDSGDAQITTTFTGRIMATGHAVLFNGSAVAGEFRCQLFISDGTGPTNGLTPISSLGTSTTQAISGVGQTQTLAGAAVKPPGTYNVRMDCLETTGNILTEKATLIEWAAAS